MNLLILDDGDIYCDDLEYFLYEIGDLRWFYAAVNTFIHDQTLLSAYTFTLYYNLMSIASTEPHKLPNKYGIVFPKKW